MELNENSGDDGYRHDVGQNNLEDMEQNNNSQVNDSNIEDLSEHFSSQKTKSSRKLFLNASKKVV